ncbi:MAG TPA: hypothetical protein VFY35_02270 [Burkholderiaceae bacterium]|nr:hypothetical protein [Burkholderiaceae bacterium]
MKISLVVPVFNEKETVGKESALFAGLETQKWQDGADVVPTKRIDRSSDHFLQRKTAEVFYRLHDTISEPKIQENVGYFRLMLRRLASSKCGCIIRLNQNCPSNQ